MEKLEQLRAKPYHVKRMISATVAAGITFIIVIFWVVSISISGGSTYADNASAQIAASPFSTLSASAADAFAPVATAFESLKNKLTGSGNASTSNAIQMYSPAEATQQATQQNQSAQMNTINQ